MYYIVPMTIALTKKLKLQQQTSLLLVTTQDKASNHPGRGQIKGGLAGYTIQTHMPPTHGHGHGHGHAMGMDMCHMIHEHAGNWPLLRTTLMLVY